MTDLPADHDPHEGSRDAHEWAMLIMADVDAVPDPRNLEWGLKLPIYHKRDGARLCIRWDTEHVLPFDSPRCAPYW